MVYQPEKASFGLLRSTLRFHGTLLYIFEVLVLQPVCFELLDFLWEN